MLVDQVAAMKQKLKWYAENQSMLDKDVEIIRAKDGQIGMLEKRIAQLQVIVILLTITLYFSYDQIVCLIAIDIQLMADNEMM